MIDAPDITIPICTCTLAMTPYPNKSDSFYCSNCDHTQPIELTKNGHGKRVPTEHDRLFAANSDAQYGEWYAA